MAGHLRTQRRRDLSSGGRSWTPEDTGGHATKAVRDREAPVSNSSSPWLYIQQRHFKAWPRTSGPLSPYT